MVAVLGQRKRHGVIVPATDDDRGLAFGQFHDQGFGQGDLVGRQNQRGDVVKWHAPHFIIARPDHHEPAVFGQVTTVLRDFDNLRDDRPSPSGGRLREAVIFSGRSRGGH